MEASRREIRCNKQFYQTLNSKKRIVCHQGGSRSGKTFSLLQIIIYWMTVRKDPLVITIARRTLPALKGSTLRDFLDIAKTTGIYQFSEFNKTELTFKYKNHLVEFLSLDSEIKIRGRKRNIAFLNECNEIDKSSFNQIALRTTERILLDFNPSDVVSWVYDVMARDDCDSFITTYKDNFFIDPEVKKEILRLKDVDKEMWRVYGEGKRANWRDGQIYDNWKFVDLKDFPDKEQAEVVYACDFGFSNDPSAACMVMRKNGKLYVHELFYAKGMTNEDIFSEITKLALEQELWIFDSAEAKSLEEMSRMGLYCKGSIKGAGSVMAGINQIRQYEVYASKESKNLQKEYTWYVWESDREGTRINKIKQNSMDHCMDAIRYGVTTGLSKHRDLVIV